MKVEDINMPREGSVLGVGVDLIEVSRIADMLERHGERFLKRVYTEQELKYCMGMKYPQKHLAARFAAKEAVSKCFGTGIGSELSWKSISVINGANGEPNICFDEKGTKLLSQKGGEAVLISLSHTESMAVAFAVLVAATKDV
jgi:holo-[acyl-carrier protein] synthase